MKPTSAPFAWLAVAGAFWLAAGAAMYAFATPGRTAGSTAHPWGLPLACLATFVAVALNIAAMRRRPDAPVIGLALGSAVAGLLLMWAAAAR